jgi:hypothetical protein
MEATSNSGLLLVWANAGNPATRVKTTGNRFLMATTLLAWVDAANGNRVEQQLGNYSLSRCNVMDHDDFAYRPVRLLSHRHPIRLQSAPDDIIIARSVKAPEPPVQPYPVQRPQFHRPRL